LRDKVRFSPLPDWGSYCHLRQIMPRGWNLRLLSPSSWRTPSRLRPLTIATGYGVSAIGGRGEQIRLEDRFQHQLGGGLGHPIADRGTPAGVRHLPVSGSLPAAPGREPARHQGKVLAQRRRPLIHSGPLNVPKAHPVHLGRAVIVTSVFPGMGRMSGRHILSWKAGSALALQCDVDRPRVERSINWLRSPSAYCTSTFG
jgi:hypothetical protein